MLMINKSKLPQVMDTPGRAIPMVVHPGCVFEGSLYTHLLPEYFEKFDIWKLYDQESVLFIRSFALGDVIQLIPVLRRVKEHYRIKKITICTMSDILKLQPIFPDIKFMTENTMRSLEDKFPIKVNLDSILECDHSLENQQNSQHRIDIYFKFFDLPPIDKRYLEWEGEISEVNLPHMEKTKTYIGVQMRGSGEIKTLPFNYLKSLISTLSKDYTIILLDSSKDFGFEGENILNLCGKLSLHQCIALLNNISACITMDSGMLWMAHVAGCPVLTILGPTREQERISLHPLYPHKARSISISEELIGCKPCFETKAYCGGRIRCMKDFPHERLTKLIQEKLKLILGDFSNGETIQKSAD